MVLVVENPPTNTRDVRDLGLIPELPFRSLGDLPNPGIEPGSLALQADTLSSEPQGGLHVAHVGLFFLF